MQSTPPDAVVELQASEGKALTEYFTKWRLNDLIVRRVCSKENLGELRTTAQGLHGEFTVS